MMAAELHNRNPDFFYNFKGIHIIVRFRTSRASWNFILESMLHLWNQLSFWSNFSSLYS